MGSPTKLKDYEMLKSIISRWNLYKASQPTPYVEKHFKPFWMVVRKPMKGQPNGTLARCRHYKEESALKEAQRLANLTGRPFLITHTVGRIDPVGETS